MQILNRVVCSYLAGIRPGGSTHPPDGSQVKEAEKIRRTIPPLIFDGVVRLGHVEVGDFELWSHRCSHYRWRPRRTGASARGA